LLVSLVYLLFRGARGGCAASAFAWVQGARDRCASTRARGSSPPGRSPSSRGRRPCLPGCGQPAACGELAGGRSSSVLAPCWVGIAGSFGDAGLRAHFCWPIGRAEHFHACWKEFRLEPAAGSPYLQGFLAP